MTRVKKRQSACEEASKRSAGMASDQFADNDCPDAPNGPTNSCRNAREEIRATKLREFFRRIWPLSGRGQVDQRAGTRDNSEHTETKRSVLYSENRTSEGGNVCAVRLLE